MLKTIVLSLHLAGALATGLIVTVAVVAMLKEHSQKYASLASGLGLVAGFQLLSGAALLLLTPASSPLAFCGRIGLYLGVVIVVELALHARLGRLGFPTRLVGSSLAIGFVGVSAAVLATY